ncbi:MAG: hypothetical protein ACI97B_003750 [Verrucomicrobiales bacterium]|jgi:hypothetical protein
MTAATKKHAVHGIICLMIAYAALLPNFYLIYNEVNRFVLQWSPATHASILMAILLMGAACFAVYRVGHAIVQHNKKLKPLAVMGATWLLYFILLRSLINILNSTHSVSDHTLAILDKTPIKLLYYFALPAPLLLFARQVSNTALCKLYLVTSPILLLFLTAPLVWRSQVPSFEAPAEIGPTPIVSTNEVPGLIVIIFDEWDYEMTFPDGTLREGLPHLQSLLNEATLYTDAQAEGAMTATSVTKFLFQRNPEYLKKTHAEIYENIYKNVPFVGPSIYSNFDDRYTKALIGYFLNYPHMIGKDLDVCLTMPIGGKLPFWDNTLELLKTQGACLRFVGIHLESKKLRGEETLFWNIVEPVHNLTMELLERTPKPVVGVFHYPIPHDPFIYDRNGKKETIDTTMNLAESLRDRDGYLDNLDYLDTILGQLIQALKDQGRYDKTMFVIMSDHAWRLNEDKGYFADHIEDAKPDSLFKHVPLVIREPGQQTARRVDERFKLISFYAYLEAYLNENYPGALTP